MNILKLAIKSVVSYYLAVRIFKPDVLLDTIVTFALLYGLVTYYIEYFPYYVSSDYIEDYIDGIFVLLLLPLIGVGIGYYILLAVLPDKLGQFIYSAAILIYSFRCLIRDIVGSGN